jgi:dTDP-4-dehydrorhamnose reductase
LKKILVTGANGQLGNEIAVLSKDTAFEFLFVDREHLDITSADSVNTFFAQHHINFVINCAAYTAVDKAETDQEQCYNVNEKGAQNLAVAAAAHNAFLFHISTDFVFDGTVATLLSEEQPVSPLSVYGASKLAGERAIVSATSQYMIIRTSWLYSSFGANFVKTILRLCKEKPSLNIIADQVGTPTYAADLAKLILDICAKENLDGLVGLYHYSNEGIASWYDFAIAIRDIAGLQTVILPIETFQYPTPATRPKYSVMNKKKIKEALAIKIPYWRSSLEICVKKINE